MTRTEKIALFNRVANSPEVLRSIAPGLEYVDFSSFFSDPRNVMLGDVRGLVVFFAAGNAEYDVHFLLTDALRGNDALCAIRLSLNYMFTARHASAIHGSTPRENRACRAIARALGARPVGVTTDFFGRACLKYSIERDKWAILSGSFRAPV